MSSLLAIETASDACSVACISDGSLLIESTLYLPRSHSERLAPMIEDVLRTCRVERPDAIAVSSGPGSYTGLRIGVSTAKGLAMAYAAELIGVPTLEALAAETTGIAHEDDLVAALTRARRNEWYAGAYRVSGEGIALDPVEAPSVVNDDTLPAWLSGLEAGAPAWLVLVGTELDLSISAQDQQVAQPHVLKVRAPLARCVARQGWLRWQRGMTENNATFEPAYLRPYRPKKATSPFSGG